MLIGTTEHKQYFVDIGGEAYVRERLTWQFDQMRLALGGLIICAIGYVGRRLLLGTLGHIAHSENSQIINPTPTRNIPRYRLSAKGNTSIFANSKSSGEVLLTRDLSRHLWQAEDDAAPAVR